MAVRRGAIAAWVFALAGLFLCSGLGLAGAQTTPAPSAEESLVTALGYGAVYNYRKSVAICDEVLAGATDPKIQARAHWVKAVAYRNYSIEYRDKTLFAVYDNEARAVKQMAPDLYLDVLARLDVVYSYYVSEDAPATGALERYRKECEPTAATEALSAYTLGQAWWQAAEQTKDGDPKVLKGYRNQAVELLKKACELRPSSYEFRGYWMTFLAETNRADEAVQVGKSLMEDFVPPDPFAFDRDPACLYSAAMNLVDPQQGRAILVERSRVPDAGASVYLELALARVNNETISETDSARILGEFIRKAEEGNFPTRGYEFRSLASGYYKLAYWLNRLNLPEQALSVYQTLGTISPCYAQLHYNMAVLYVQLADAAEEPESKRDLLNRARKEYEIQGQYNYKGGGIRISREGIDRVEKKLQALSIPPPAPTPVGR